MKLNRRRMLAGVTALGLGTGAKIYDDRKSDKVTEQEKDILGAVELVEQAYMDNPSSNLPETSHYSVGDYYAHPADSAKMVENLLESRDIDAIGIPYTPGGQTIERFNEGEADPRSAGALFNHLAYGAEDTQSHIELFETVREQEVDVYGLGKEVASEDRIVPENFTDLVENVENMAEENEVSVSLTDYSHVKPSMAFPIDAALHYQETEELDLSNLQKLEETAESFYSDRHGLEAEHFLSNRIENSVDVFATSPTELVDVVQSLEKEQKANLEGRPVKPAINEFIDNSEEISPSITYNEELDFYTTFTVLE